MAITLFVVSVGAHRITENGNSEFNHQLEQFLSEDIVSAQEETSRRAETLFPPAEGWGMHIAIGIPLRREIVVGAGMNQLFAVSAHAVQFVHEDDGNIYVEHECIPLFTPAMTLEEAREHAAKAVLNVFPPEEGWSGHEMAVEPLLELGVVKLPIC